MTCQSSSLAAISGISQENHPTKVFHPGLSASSPAKGSLAPFPGRWTLGVERWTVHSYTGKVRTGGCIFK